jgi:HTH-type transcriptional regulator / antitoxin HipB
MAELVRSPKQLGVVLRRFRRGRDLTQAELAKRAGLRQGTVSQVETGLAIRQAQHRDGYPARA